MKATKQTNFSKGEASFIDVAYDKFTAESMANKHVSRVSADRHRCRLVLGGKIGDPFWTTRRIEVLQRKQSRSKVFADEQIVGIRRDNAKCVGLGLYEVIQEKQLCARFDIHCESKNKVNKKGITSCC